jgi:hypothetical protein
MSSHRATTKGKANRHYSSWLQNNLKAFLISSFSRENKICFFLYFSASDKKMPRHHSTIKDQGFDRIPAFTNWNSIGNISFPVLILSILFVDLFIHGIYQGGIFKFNEFAIGVKI